MIHEFTIFILIVFKLDRLPIASARSSPARWQHIDTYGGLTEFNSDQVGQQGDAACEYYAPDDVHYHYY